MPKINDLPLPSVKVTAPMDLEVLASKLGAEPMSPEAMVETIIYLRREMAKATALAVVEAALRDKLAATYAALPPEKRETRRCNVGLATYSEGGEKVELIDRDKTVETLTTEQLRITYKADLAALQTILKPDAFNRLVKRTPKPPVLTVREQKGSEAYEELDFEDF